MCHTPGKGLADAGDGFPVFIVTAGRRTRGPLATERIAPTVRGGGGEARFRGSTAAEVIILTVVVRLLTSLLSVFFEEIIQGQRGGLATTGAECVVVSSANPCRDP